MDLNKVIDPPPSTPPREQQDEINLEAEQLQRDEVDEEEEEKDEEEEEEDEERPRKVRGRQRYCILGTGLHFWTRKSMQIFCKEQLRRWSNQGLSNGQLHGPLQRHWACGLS
jgi:hypothetical protein